MQAELRNRLLIGPCIALAAIVALGLDLVFHTTWGALVVAVVITTTATWEYARLARSADLQVARRSLMVGNLLLLLIAMPALLSPLGLANFTQLPGLTLGLVLVWMAWAQMRHDTSRFFRDLAASILGLLYIGWCMHLWCQLAHLGGPDNPTRGVQLLLVTLAVCKVGDTTAFFGGKALGRHKLAPRLSPGKTWEGAACGLLGGIAAAYLASWLLSGPWSPGGASPLNGWWSPLAFALCVAPAGMLGDLAESCLKRAGAVKDSSTAIPGFGGFLDIYDAILLSVPVALLLAQILP